MEESARPHWRLDGVAGSRSTCRDQGDRTAGGNRVESKMEDVMESIKDASHLYEVERRALHAERPGFRISELQIGPTQSVPWHFHSAIQDTFYVIEGAIRLLLRDPQEEVRLGRGETYTVRARRPH